jgi:hypothetical protein
MALTPVDKCAGRRFRADAEFALAEAWLMFPKAVPCSAQVRFFRHECPVVKGRTRAIRLDDRTLTSPEIWVCWTGSELEAISQSEAQQRLADGIVAEYEQVLAGKFSFTWKAGRCGHCELTAMSREGVLEDARPVQADAQGDLASSVGWPGGLPSLKREVGTE